MNYWVSKEQLQKLIEANNGNQIFVLCNKIAREQKIITERTESLTKGLVLSLLVFNENYAGKPSHLQDVPLTKNQYNNFQKLQYHRLVSHVKSGYWDLTPQGKLFIHGEPVPKNVTVDNGQITGVSKQKTTINKLLGAVKQTAYPQRRDYL